MKDNGIDSITRKKKVLANQLIEDREYWVNRLSGEIEKNYFPYDFHTSEFEVESVQFTWGGELFKRLMKVSGSSAPRLHMILLAGLAALLGKYSGNRDIIIGIPIDRQDTKGQPLNTILPIRLVLTGGETFKELLLETRRTINEAIEHQNYPIEELVKEMSLESSAGNFPLFDVCLLLENIQVKTYIEHLYPHIIFSFLGTDDALEGKVDYCSSSYRRDTIQRITHRFLQLLEQAIGDVNVPVDDIELLTEEERQQLKDFNNTTAPYPGDLTIHELFEQQVEVASGEVALICENWRVTYGELNAAANRVARALRSMGVQSESIVGIITENSIEVVIGILGILKAGAAYLPIETHFPQERKAYMLRDSGTRILLTINPEHSSAVPGWEGEILDIETFAREPSETSNFENTSKPTDLSYIIYTSGSTGKPKGVLIEHRGLVNYVCWAVKTYIKNEKTVFPLFTSAAFDLTLTSLFPPLVSGNTIVVYRGDERDFLIEKIMEENRVNAIKLTPGHMRMIGREMAENSIIRRFIVGGEQLDASLAGEACGFFGDIEIYNEYGPTEAVVGCMIYKFDSRRDRDGAVPIGIPADNVNIYLLDQSQKPVPVGCTGEMYIASPGLARGYLNNPELTNQKFLRMFHGQGAVFTKRAPPNRVPAPRVRRRQRIYKTGDLARLLPDGNMMFLGRKDRQVKIRGYRVETGEIEICLVAYKGIKEAVVLAKQEETGYNYLCAYIVPASLPVPTAPSEDSNHSLNIPGLKDYLSGQLPGYMIPSYFVQLEKIPLTSHGKVDQKALPEPNTGGTGEAFEAPRDELEKDLMGIWAEVLDREQSEIGINTNFFDYGGNSIKATRLVSKIHQTLNVRIQLGEIFKTPVIKNLSKHIKGLTEVKYTSINPVEKKDYYALSSAQKRLFILQRLDLESKGYNLPEIFVSGEKLDEERFDRTFKKLINRHESLRTSFDMINGEPVQKIHDKVDFEIEYYKTGGPGSDRDESLNWPLKVEEIVSNFIKPFDLYQAPLLKVGIIKAMDEGDILMVDMHHIISDGISHAVLIKDFMNSYMEEELPLLRLQYKDFSEWQNGETQQQVLESQKDYWLKKFAGEIPIIHLPTDYTRPEVQSFEGNNINFEIDGEDTKALNQLANKHGATLNIVILAVFNVLLAKLCNQEDIIIGTPVAGRKYVELEQIMGIFVNTLAMRNSPTSEKVFTYFFDEVKESTLRAFENQDYPFEELVEQVEVDRDVSRNPVFDVMFTFLNMDDPEIERPALRLLPYQYKSRIAKFDLSLWAKQTESHLSFSFEYCTKLFKQETIERFISYFKEIVTSTLIAPGIKILDIEIILEEEKKQILFDFNDTDADYPQDKTIHELFSEQVKRTPDHIALLGKNPKLLEGTRELAPFSVPVSLSYRQLDEKSDQLARLLIEKGTKADTIVGIKVERSVEMIIGILGILKAGGAYLPIDPGYPEKRINYMLSDSAAKVLLTDTDLTSWLSSSPKGSKILPKDSTSLEIWNAEFGISPRQGGQLAYTIYTSGSTGKPKGVMIEHRSLVNFIHGITAVVDFNESDHVLSLTTISFDIFGLETHLPLTKGARVVIGSSEEGVNPVAASRVISRQKVTVLQLTPSRLSMFISNEESSKVLSSLKYLFVGGEAFPWHLLEKIKKVREGRIYNLYGPTETTIWSTVKEVTSGKNLNIGSPISNTHIYILGIGNTLQPIEIPGELCISGAGLARGYVNRPELTAGKFADLEQALIGLNSYMGLPSDRRGSIYRTGDLARWLPDGNIEFLGRIDHQVKIRGFRIELGEIETELLSRDEIKETVVEARKDKRGNISLCAYIVSDKELKVTQLRTHLSGTLPDYMLPSYFIKLDTIPLTPNGKVDRKALPEPGTNTGTDYSPPRNNLEKKLVEIWSEVLAISKDTLGIDANFFELGGHSLTAIIIISRLQKEFNVKIKLTEMFKFPKIRALGEFLKGAETEIFVAVKQTEKKEYYRLSSAQKRLYILHQMEPGGTAYNMSQRVVLEGKLELERLEETFKKMTARHESLRTSFLMINDNPVQKIHKMVKAEIDYYKVGEPGHSSREVDEIINRFIKPFDLSRAPLLRVGLLETNENRYILMVDMHHIISDGVSHTILISNFIDLYKGEELSPLPFQYKDFSEWQNSDEQITALESQKEYWLREFAGEIPILNLTPDYIRPEVQSFEGSTVNFEIGGDTKEALNQLAKKHGATLYIILLAVFNVLLAKLSNQEDIIIGTPVAGRKHADMEQVMGMFVNTLAMRNSPTSEKVFTYFLQEVKDNTLRVFENQDYPFEELVEQVEVDRDVSRNPLFDVMFAFLNMDVPEIEIPGLRLLPYKYKTRIAKFDLTLWAKETENNLSFSFEYCTKLFKQETIERFISFYKKIISSIQDNLDKKIFQIEIISDKEKKNILFDFNDTDAESPENKTIQGLFEEQIKRTPDNIAVIGEAHQLLERGSSKGKGELTPFSVPVSISYRQLDEKTDQLARLLIEKGAKSDTIVGIIVERSVEMIIGILGILKAGGAYLPIDPGYPRERINYMLTDSQAKILLTTKNIAKAISFDKEMIYLNSTLSPYHPSTLPSTHLHLSHAPATSLAYIIYTSGSTGKPKGVMVEHRSVVNRLNWMQREYPISPGDVILQKTPFTFDVSVWELFWWSFHGASICLLGHGNEKDPAAIIEAIERIKVTTIHFVPSMLNAFLEYLENLENLNGLSTLKQVFASGEALIINHIETFNRRLNRNKTKLINLYGPTEATVDVSYFNCPVTEKIEKIPIGKPIDNIRLYVVNKSMGLQPIGIPGELCISGIGAARGYLNKQELTEETFIKAVISSSKKHSKHTNDRFYRTGDLARWLPDGNIEFLGRIDHQVKIRGFRIELGEIESELLTSEEIKETVVEARKDKNGNIYLCAYIVSDKEFKVTQLRSHLSGTLPDYMLPSYFIKLDTIPLTPNGKVDRKALPEPETNKGTGYSPPGNNIEKKLVDIWSEVLGINKNTLGIDANFFELGGHSLTAIILISRLQREFNVKIKLSEIFKFPKIRALGEFLKGAETEIFVAVKQTEKKEYYRLSSAQKRLYILHQIESGGTAYNMSQRVVLEGKLEIERFEEILKKMIARYESLRTSFLMINDNPVQKIHKRVKPEIHHHKVGYPGHSSREVDEIINRFVKPFDLSYAPLLRVGLLETNDNRYILMVDMHHIISDATSHTILISNFIDLYKGEELSPLPFQYKDFSEWRHGDEQIKALENQREYWLKEFDGDVPVLNLPIDYVRPGLQSFAGSVVHFEIGVEETKELNNLAIKERTTLYVVLLAVFHVLLSKVSSQEDIIIGTPTAGRQHMDLRKIIGMFVNTLALRNQSESMEGFTDFLQRLKENTLKAFENQDYPFEELVEQVSLERDVSRNPLFDVMFSWLKLDNTPKIDIPGMKLTPYRYETRISKFDLTLWASESEDHLSCSFEYCTKLFKQETIQRFISFFKRIISAVLKDPGQKTSGIRIISEEEKQQVLFDLNDTEARYPADKTIHELFAIQVEQNPHHTALVQEDKVFTFREVNKRANQWVRRLRDVGVGQETVVSIMSVRSPGVIIGILGILKAGAAFLPIDPQYPGPRQRFILQDSETRVLMTQKAIFARYKEILQPDGLADILFLNDQDEDPEAVKNPENINKPGDLAYIIYTSGTSGKPKGAMIEHRGLVNYTWWAAKTYVGNNPLNFPLYTSISFDLTITSIFTPLITGNAVVVYEEEREFLLEKIIDENRVGVVKLTPSHLKLIKEKKIPGMLCSIKRFIVGGEPLENSLAKEIHQVFSGTVEIYNEYGPTETVVGCMIYRFNPAQVTGQTVPIGRPINNTQIYILDKRKTPVPFGIPGELYVSGNGVCRGYLKRKELNLEKFISNPFAPHNRMYRTGDLARRLADGNIEFLGRIDQQLKIRGFRIEPAEIANHLLQHEEINDAVVSAIQNQDREASLCAYITGQRQFSTTELREYLAKELPDYMIPSYFIQVETIPLTPNGKVDQKALHSLDINLNTGVQYAPPENEIEELIAAAWKEVLHIDHIGVHDNFFDVGGHSLGIIRMNNKLKKLFQKDIPVVEMFRYPTIHSLAQYLDNTEMDEFLSDEKIDRSLGIMEEATEFFLGNQDD